DIWAAILYGLTFLGFLGLLFLSFASLSAVQAELNNPSRPEPTTRIVRTANGGTRVVNGTNPGFENPLRTIPAKHIASVVILTILLSLSMTVGYFIMMMKFAGKMIHVSYWAGIGINLAVAALSFISGNRIGGIFLTIVSILFAITYYYIRHKIPFAKQLLKLVTAIAKQYPATITTGLVATVVAAVFEGLWLFTVIVMAIKLHGSAGFIPVVLFLAFVLYWTSQVIGNVVHVTISGLFATVYFMGSAVPGTATTTRKFNVPVQNPTAKSAKRAMTTSFGSICYGSLIIAIVQLIREIVNAVLNNSDDGFMCFLACCMQCILSCFQGLLELFNHYAFTQVAIYGKNYCDAAKSTWTLIKNRGLEAIINDNLVSNVLWIGGFLIAVLCGVFVHVYLTFSPDIKQSNPIAVILGLVIGLSMFGSVVAVVSSGVSTTFVCLAEDPATMQKNAPEVFAKLVETYPDVVNGLQSTAVAPGAQPYYA
ncbi:putative choline transporter, neither null mutation nor overexpression affects choline transport, partial [Quaeritorhiza haematococci]